MFVKTGVHDVGASGGVGSPGVKGILWVSWQRSLFTVFGGGVCLKASSPHPLHGTRADMILSVCTRHVQAVKPRDITHGFNPGKSRRGRKLLCAAGLSLGPKGVG
jgi:hypothetical protein